MVSTLTISLAAGSRHWRVRAGCITPAEETALRRVLGCAVHRTADGFMLVFRPEPEPERWVWHGVCVALRREVDVVASDHMELLRVAELGVPAGVGVLVLS